MSGELQQAALIALVRSDHREAGAAFQNSLRSLQHETTQCHGLVVTGQAILLENGQKILLEINESAGLYPGDGNRLGVARQRSLPETEPPPRTSGVKR